MVKFGTILHPTDFSTGSDCAFRLAASLARDHGARLLVLYVSAPELDAYHADDPIEKAQAVAARMKELLERAEAVDPRMGEIHIDMEWVEGEPVHEIVRAAQTPDCGLVVLGTHGRGGVARLLMGSVAEGVVCHAPCPVVTVKGPAAPAVRSGEVSCAAATATAT